MHTNELANHFDFSYVILAAEGKCCIAMALSICLICATSRKLAYK